MEVKVKLLDPRATLPTRGSEEAAGADLRTLEALTVPAHQTVQAHTGIALELPLGYAGLVYARSGMALKFSMTLLNTPGTIDAGYRGEVGCIMFNAGEQPYEIKRGDRIAQMVIAALPDVQMVECGELTETDRGAGGFGSTGKQ